MADQNALAAFLMTGIKKSCPMVNETILAYLENLCRKLKLSKDEKDKIDVSFTAVRNKLISAFFDDGLKDVRVFGSFDRGTLLSRTIDNESDVDILVMFDKKNFEAQTYLNKLKRFAEANYSRSDIYQDYPTIVIAMDHIRFELVPCIYSPETTWNYESFTIPRKNGDNVEWITTKPDYYKKKIEEGFPKTRETLIKIIQLFKYWNLINKFPYSTYQVEKFIIEHFDYEENILYNLFKAIDNLHFNNPLDVQNATNKKAKKHTEKINILLGNDMGEYALMELCKLLPPIN